MLLNKNHLEATKGKKFGILIFTRSVKDKKLKGLKGLWKIKDELMNDNWDLEVIEVCSPVPVILCTLYT